MKSPDLIAEVERWIRYAREDYATTERLLLDPENPPRHICWLAQQSAEKAIKAALIWEGLDFPYRHDLDALRQMLPKSWAIHTEAPDLADLTEWAVEARYPGDWPDPTPSAANDARQQAEIVLASIFKDLAAKGFPVDKMEKE